MGMTRFVLGSVAVTLAPLACNLPQSESFGENTPRAGSGAGAPAGASGTASVQDSGAAGRGIDRGSGGSSSGGTGGRRDTGHTGGSSSGGTAGRHDAGDSGATSFGGAAGLGNTGDSGGSSSGGAAGRGETSNSGAGGQDDVACEYAYCLTLAEGLELSNACPLRQSDYVMPECGSVTSGVCRGRDTVRQYVVEYGDYLDCYFEGGALVGMANVTDHGTWIAGEVTVNPASCAELTYEDIPLCPKEVTSVDGIDCPATLPEIGSACADTGRCAYTFELHCTEGCTTQAAHKVRCLRGAWLDDGMDPPYCDSCEMKGAADCPEAEPSAGMSCPIVGAVCTYGRELDCPEGCSGGDMQQYTCIERSWYDTMHTAGAPECQCP